jgi:hypothetical protein
MGTTVSARRRHEDLSDIERIDRELRERIRGEQDTHATQFECEGCAYRHCLRDYFEDFHGLFLCDGCAYHAREVLRELQEPLVERLAAEPTLEHAQALGFELMRRADGRLAWVSDDDEYDGGSFPYGDEQEALDGLVGELW